MKKQMKIKILGILFVAAAMGSLLCFSTEAKSFGENGKPNLSKTEMLNAVSGSSIKQTRYVRYRGRIYRIRYRRAYHRPRYRHYRYYRYYRRPRRHYYRRY